VPVLSFLFRDEKDGFSALTQGGRAIGNFWFACPFRRGAPPLPPQYKAPWSIRNGLCDANDLCFSVSRDACSTLSLTIISLPPYAIVAKNFVVPFLVYPRIEIGLFLFSQLLV